MRRYLVGCSDIGGCRVSSRMKRRFPRLLMVDNLNPSLFFRKAQTPLAKRFATGFIEPEFAIGNNRSEAGLCKTSDWMVCGLRSARSFW
jgi:hypothetical protein